MKELDGNTQNTVRDGRQNKHCKYLQPTPISAYTQQFSIDENPVGSGVKLAVLVQ